MRSGEYRKAVYTWLWIGMVMLFFQVVIGGITRLTESGLSITKWEIITGTLPPMTEKAWEDAFDLYKNTPQYKEVNEGMSMDTFKYIYFWEYFHRLWARIMGLVFFFPFLFFLYKKAFSRKQIVDLLILIFLAALAAGFGWIMVASGLIERPWVNAYNLSLHLLVALSVIGYLWWIIIQMQQDIVKLDDNWNPAVMRSSMNGMLIFIVIVLIQIFLGGMMSGMKIAVLYPTWPDMYGEYFPDILFDSGSLNIQNVVDYDSNSYFPTLIHFLHRNWAYLVVISGVWLLFKLYNKSIEKKIPDFRNAVFIIVGIIVIQFILGILTVISSLGKVPVLFGVLHQSGGLILYLSVLYIIFVLLLSRRKFML